MGVGIEMVGDMKRKSEKGLLGVIAVCSDCDFRDEDYKTGQKSGRQHHYKTGHEVNIEVTYNVIFKRSEQGGIK
jgi:hypothetical protein